MNPKQLSHWKTGVDGTHRNSYPGGKYAYLSASQPGFKERILIILDVSDPKNPKEEGRWWPPFQKEGEPVTGPIAGFHGPVVIEGTTAYMGYGPAVVILDVADVVDGRVPGHAFRARHAGPEDTGRAARHR